MTEANSIFREHVSLEAINAWGTNTLVEALGIEVTEVGPDFVRGRMPVDSRTKQPYGLLHGGASIALAETLGSIAAGLVVGRENLVVGLEINGNHIKSARSGWVEGIAKPLHLGSRTQVWEIRISNAANELLCISRLTMAVKAVTAKASEQSP